MDLNLGGGQALFIPVEQAIWDPNAQIIPGVILLESLMGATKGL